MRNNFAVALTGWTIFLLSCLPVSALWTGTAAATPAGPETMRALIEAGEKEGRLAWRGELLFAPDIIPRFYAEEGYRLVWSGPDGTFPLAEPLLLAIRAGEAEGLSATVYHLDAITTLLARIRAAGEANTRLDGDSLAGLDLLLTDAFLLHASHRLAGRVDPETLQANWVAFSPEADLAAILRRALASGRVRETLESLDPVHPDYRRLRQALRELREIMARGEWPLIPVGPNLESGMVDERVPLLRARLIAGGDLEAGAGDSEEFDAPLAEAVRRFQARHGLGIDGVVGLLTRAELNVSARKRAEQIEVNLERRRWLFNAIPEDRYILINIAGYRMTVHEGLATVLEKKVVVGASYRHTPLFSERMQYIDINPFWNIPPTIAVRDILPNIRKDPGYLSREKIRVFSNWRDDARELDASSIDWTKVGPGHFPYKLRQDPGPRNSLGRIKFIFPNRFSVYLHDTPHRELFDKPTRDFSSGCIRVEAPLVLAAYLLQDTPSWNLETLTAAVASGRQQVIPLDRPIPVHIQYWTAWVDEDNAMQFRYDIYKRDEELARALAALQPLAIDHSSLTISH